MQLLLRNTTHNTQLPLAGSSQADENWRIKTSGSRQVIRIKFSWVTHVNITASWNETYDPLQLLVGPVFTGNFYYTFTGDRIENTIPSTQISQGGARYTTMCIYLFVAEIGFKDRNVNEKCGQLLPKSLKLEQKTTNVFAYYLLHSDIPGSPSPFNNLCLMK